MKKNECRMGLASNNDRWNRFVHVFMVTRGDMMKAVIYARISTEQQSEGSIEQQIRKCREYCSFRDYEVIEVYTDVGSGMKVTRPGYEEMMNDVEEWDVCVAYKLDRFHRSAANASSWASDLNVKNKNFAAIDIDIDTVTAMGRFIFRLMAALAQLEVEMTRERTQMGMAAVKHQGRKLGKPPYGYDSKFALTDNENDKGILIINKKEAAAIKVIFDCHKKGLSYSDIVEHLAKNKILTKTGKITWNPATIRDIIKKELLYYGKYKDEEGETKIYEWDPIL